MGVKRRLLAIKITAAMLAMAYGAAAQAFIETEGDYLEILQGDFVAIDVLANDFSTHPLSIVDVQVELGQAEVTVQPDGMLLISPPAEFWGHLEVRYYVENTKGQTAQGLVTVYVFQNEAVNHPPSIDNDLPQVSVAALAQLNAQAARSHQRAISQLLNTPSGQLNGAFVYRAQAPFGAGAGDGLLPLGGVFVSLDATRIDTKSNLASAESKTDMRGLTAGIDLNLARQWVVGAALGASTATNNTIDFDEVSFVGFAAYQYQQWQTEAQLGYTKTSAASDGAKGQAQFDVDGSVSFALAKLEYVISQNGWNVQPGIEARYESGKIDSFTDNTSAAIYSAHNTDNTFVALSLQTSYQYNVAWGVIAPQVTFASEYSVNASDTPVVITTNGTARTAQTLANRDDQSLLLDAGVGIVLRHGFSGFINYHQLFDQRAYGVKSVQLGGRWEF